MGEMGNIFIRDYIGDCNDFTGLFLVDIIKQVKSQPTAKAFKVFINSKGGDIYEAFRISDYFDSLINSGIPIITIGEKLVASSATILLLSGSEGRRFLMRDCEFMIHSPSGGVKGNTYDIVQYSQLMAKTNDLMADFYEVQMNLPNDAIVYMMEQETYFTAEDCEALGFAQVYNETPLVAMAK